MLTRRPLLLALRALLLALRAFLTAVARNFTLRTGDLAARAFELLDLERAFELRLRLRAADLLRDLAALVFLVLTRRRQLEANLASTGPSFRVVARLTGVLRSGQWQCSSLAVFLADVSDFPAAGLTARARLHGAALADLRFFDALDDRDELTAELLRFLVMVGFFATAGARARRAFFSSDDLAVAVRAAELL